MNALVNQTFNVPASGVFAGVDAGDDLSGGITGGYGMIRYKGKVWAIHYRQQEMALMRPDGDGPKGSIEIVILKANPNLSKTWYENGWDETSTNPPDCSSANGVVPDAGVPKKQNPTCLGCPRNEWGTAPNGGKGKACGDHRRLAVVPMADIPNEALGGALLLRCPAASLQDLAAYDSKYKQAGYPYFALATKISFDMKESYPKFVFEAIRPLTDAEARQVIAMRGSHEVSRVVSDAVPQAQAHLPAPAQAGFLEAPTGAPVAAVMAQQVAPQPAQPAPVAAAPAPVTQPAPAPATPVASTVPQANQAGPAANGFGAVAAPVAQPQAAPAAAPSKPVVMTGFGAAAPATQQGNQTQAAQPAREPNSPAPVQAAVASPVVVEAFDASLDDKLAALIGS